MGPELVKEILLKIRNARIAVYGDFCLDAYLIMDPEGSEISIETGIKAEAVQKHYYSPGGASNITANLADLNPAGIFSIGVLGNDIYARELKLQLDAKGITTSQLISQEKEFDTYVFVKRIMKGEEGSRIDFGTKNRRNRETDDQLLKAIEYALSHYDVLIFNQQVPGSITNTGFIDEVNLLFRKYDHKTVLLDSRHYNDRFQNVSRKVNNLELAQLSNRKFDPDNPPALDEIAEMAKNIYINKPIFITCGEKGIVSIDAKGIHHSPGIQLLDKLDTVGAGDTTLSALACCLAIGLNAEEAASFANLAAAVTVQKLFKTGTANGKEISTMSKDSDYIFNPDLAADTSKAYYLPGTKIEICNHAIEGHTNRIKHIVFDHDGTLSILRQGWEPIMENIMIDAISGGKELDRRLSERIRMRVTEYIGISTGIQTILQMDKLVDLVKEFKLVSESEVKDKFGYKSIYLKQLMSTVNDRLRDVRDGKIEKEKYQIRGAENFLRKLAKMGIQLYLTSGTDEKNVIYEAGILEYAELFNGKIYGSVDDVKKYSKKMVIESIVKKNRLKEFEFAVIGDGPVEIREGKKKAGITIGVASDEKKGYELNSNKRTKLIKAGADIIIPDFSEYQTLLSYLFSH
jgi:rfaE bifunctional protein kinase chain/domain